MNPAYKVGQFRLRFAQLEKSPKFGDGTKFTIRRVCIVEYLTIREGPLEKLWGGGGGGGGGGRGIFEAPEFFFL